MLCNSELKQTRGINLGGETALLKKICYEQLETSSEESPCRLTRRSGSKQPEDIRAENSRASLDQLIDGACDIMNC
jgi:hypothetical protein